MMKRKKVKIHSEMTFLAVDSPCPCVYSCGDGHPKMNCYVVTEVGEKET